MNERILVVDDEPDIRNLVSDILTDEGYQVQAAATANKAREFVQEADYDLVLLDIWMPGEDGISLLKDWQQHNAIQCPIVMMSGHGTVETAVEATRLGAFSFVEKPLTTAKLISTIRSALDEYKKHSQPKSNREQPLNQPVGNSQLMQNLLELCERYARVDSHLVAIGESGSGRQTILKYIHQISARNSAPFIVMDMSSLFETDLSDDDWSRFNTKFVDTNQASSRWNHIFT
jgi:DNA-binding NtrC family response regulator